jgi:hypothetical protein
VNDSTRATGLQTNNNKLNADIKTRDKSIRDLKRHIGDCVTDLDLAEAGHRVFYCRHDKFTDIPNGSNTTCEKSAGFIADNFFKDYEKDTECRPSCLR